MCIDSLFPSSLHFLSILFLESIQRRRFKPFLQMTSQTMLHGDFHNGNHMYQEDEDGTVRVVAFDFQGVGHGAAMSDVIKLLALSKSHVSLTEEFELMKKYHEALVQSGVTDYSYDELKKHFMIAGTELLAKYTMEFCFKMNSV